MSVYGLEDQTGQLADRLLEFLRSGRRQNPSMPPFEGTKFYRVERSVGRSATGSDDGDGGGGGGGIDGGR